MPGKIVVGKIVEIPVHDLGDDLIIHRYRVKDTDESRGLVLLQLEEARREAKNPPFEEPEEETASANDDEKS